MTKIDGKTALLDDYLLSIIIPTKNRFTYLHECIETLLPLLHKDKTVEVVIQDNSDDYKEYVRTKEIYESENIVFNHSDEQLSQTGNSEKALELVRGKYVCYIGDDDMITDGLIKLTKILYDNQIEACAFASSSYIWADAIEENPKLVSFSMKSQPLKIVMLDAKNELINELKNGMQIIGRLPSVYHGIVSSSILSKIKSICGCFFPGPSPDMANAVAVALMVDKYPYVYAPFLIDGRAFNSAGGMGLRGKHYAKISEVKQLAPHVEKEWDERIPRIWMGETVWPESAVKALQAMKNDKYIRYLNFGRIYISVLRRGRINWTYVKPYLAEPKNALHIMRALSTVAKNRLREKVNLRRKKIEIIENRSVQGMNEAKKITDNYLEQTKALETIQEYLKKKQGN